MPSPDQTIRAASDFSRRAFNLRAALIPTSRLNSGSSATGFFPDGSLTIEFRKTPNKAAFNGCHHAAHTLLVYVQTQKLIPDRSPECIQPRSAYRIPHR